jgi:branched-chain amino acid aminotransferase
MAIQPTSKIWMDGEYVDWDAARVHVLTPSLHYGWGVFEGIRCYDTHNGPAVFRLTDHLARLFQSAKIYHMDPPVSLEGSVKVVKDLVALNQLRECYIRPIVYLGYGEMGLNPLGAPVRMAVACWPWGAYLGEASFTTGVRVKVSSWRRLDPNIIPPAAKATGQYLNSSLAKAEAVKAGYDEGILLNPQGQVTDGSGENVFVVRGGVLCTPPLAAGCLAGITRDSILRIAADEGIPV